MTSPNRLLLIGVACVVLGAVCLLVVHFEDNAKSSSSTIAVVANGAQTASTTASTSVAIGAPMPAASAQASLETPNAQGVINTSGMQFEVVTTAAAQSRGLGGRAVIPNNYAMLFVFPSDSEPGFWMLDMLTSIDMIWLTDNGTIVSINASVPADTYPETFYPPSPIRYVLETQAGFAAAHNWVVGDRVELPAPY